MDLILLALGSHGQFWRRADDFFIPSTSNTVCLIKSLVKCLGVLGKGGSLTPRGLWGDLSPCLHFPPFGYKMQKGCWLFTELSLTRHTVSPSRPRVLRGQRPDLPQHAVGRWNASPAATCCQSVCASEVYKYGVTETNSSLWASQNIKRNIWENIAYLNNL